MKIKLLSNMDQPTLEVGSVHEAIRGPDMWAYIMVENSTRMIQPQNYGVVEDVKQSEEPFLDRLNKVVSELRVLGITSISFSNIEEKKHPVGDNT